MSQYLQFSDYETYRARCREWSEAYKVNIAQIRALKGKTVEAQRAGGGPEVSKLVKARRLMVAELGELSVIRAEMKAQSLVQREAARQEFGKHIGLSAIEVSGRGLVSASA